MNYTIKLFYSEEDKRFIAVIPDLSGCSAFGETEEDAIKEVKVAQELWLETSKREGRKYLGHSRYLLSSHCNIWCKKQLFTRIDYCKLMVYFR